MRNNNKKIMLLIAVTLLISMLYLFVGIDFEIFEYQFSSRLRKFILIILVGAAIATSVVIFQAITNNRLLTPSIMGLDAVYLFIKVLPVFLFGIQSVWVTNVYLNFILTLITMVLFALILFQGIFKIGHFSIYFILLIGVLLGTFFRSITGFIQLIMDPESFLAIQSSMFANFNASNSNLVIFSAVLLVILLVITILLLPYLDVLLLGRAEAINLGISYEKLTRILLVIVSVLVSVSTALVGPITFLGLLTVNLAHELMKTYEHKYILIATICLSWISLFSAQWVVENLTKTINNQMILEDISIDIEKGKLTSLIGPNGAGKSTLLSAICRLIRFDNGEVKIDGQLMSDYKNNDLSKKISILKQTNHTEMNITVEQLVNFGRFPYSKGRLTKEDHDIVNDALDLLQLQDIRNRNIKSLSGGQRQRAYIAMTIAQDTEYILLDEPLNNLDMKHAVQIMQTLKMLAHKMNKAIVIVLHDINFASCYSDQIVALKNGQLVKSDLKDNVIQSSVLSDLYDMNIQIEHIRNQRICLYFKD